MRTHPKQSDRGATPLHDSSKNMLAAQMYQIGTNRDIKDTLVQAIALGGPTLAAKLRKQVTELDAETAQILHRARTTA